MTKQAKQDEAKFKSMVVEYACGVYKRGTLANKTNAPEMQLLKRALENVNPIGPETLREVASNARDGVYAAELDALVTEIQK